MFPRAARFSQRKLSDTPGPNAYDPTEMMAHYKKGLLNQTDARFKSTSNVIEDPSTSAAGLAATLIIPNGNNGSAVIDAIGPKEKAKLMAKIAKAEDRAVELEKQTHTLSNEKSQAMADLRRSQQLVDKLQTQIGKTKTQTTKAESSQLRIVELQKIIDQNVSKHKSELERCEAKSAKLQGERDEAEARLQEARAVVASTEKYVQTLRSSESNLRQQLEGERDRRKQTEDELSDALNGCEAQESAVEKLLSEKWHQLDRVEELENLQEEMEERLQSLSQERRAIEQIAISSLKDSTECKEELSSARQDIAIANMTIRRLKSEIDNRSDREDELLESVTDIQRELQEERDHLRDADLLADDLLSRDRQIKEHDLEGDLMVDTDDTIEKHHVRSIISDILTMTTKADLEDQRRVCTRLMEDLEENHERYLHILRKNATMQSSNEKTDKLRQELESVEEAYEKTLLELMRAHRSEEEAKGEIVQLKADNQGLTSKVKHFEQLSKKVFHAKVKEEAWLQEREELLQELGRLSEFEGDYQSLRTQAQMLLSKSSSYEAQMEEMSSLNIMLASHSNPSQKVIYLERVRRELDDKKVECQLLHTQKDELQAKCKELQGKVDLFYKIDNRVEDRPRTGYRRVTRQASTGVLRERSPNLSAPVPPLPRPTTPGPKKLEIAKMPTTPRSRTPLNIFKWGLGVDTTSDTTLDDDGEMTLDEIMVSV